MPKMPSEAAAAKPHKPSQGQPSTSAGLTLSSIHRRAWKKGVPLSHRCNLLDVRAWPFFSLTQLCFVALCDVVSTHPPSVSVYDAPATAGFRLNDVVEIV